MKRVYVICGPTAAGKTSLAIRLAQKLKTAVISADSRQCYNEMTIGTAKPTGEELQAVKHYFINEFSINEMLSAADFEKLALGYLSEIFASSDYAVVCGGTGLYIQALVEGLDEMPKIDETIAKEVEAAYAREGIAWLRNAVEHEDPEFFKVGEINNPARLLRALIFKRSTGKSILDFRTRTLKSRPFEVIKIALELPRELLYSRINARVDLMMEDGLLEEVKGLYAYRHLKNMETVGYSELLDYLDGKWNLEMAIEKIKQHTRNYAKRQMTWFRRDATVNWFKADDEHLIDKILRINN